jgi:hypothetical protein
MLREFTIGSNRYAIKTNTDTICSDEIRIPFSSEESVRKFFSISTKERSYHLNLVRIAKDVAPSYCCRPHKKRSKLSDQDYINKLYDRIFSGELKVVQKSNFIKRRVDPIGWFDWDKFFADPRVQHNFHELSERVQLATIRAWQKEKKAMKITEVFKPTVFSGTSSSRGTIGIGGTFTAGTGKAVSGTVMIIFDECGNVGYLKSAGGGGMGGSSVSGSFIIQVTNAKDIYKLKGLSVQSGGSAGKGGAIGIEYVIGSGYQGVNFTFGVAGGLTVAELHSIAEYASVKGASVDDMITYVKQLKLLN